MKIIKIPKPIQLRCKHPSTLSTRTHKPLKLNPSFSSKPPLPPLKSSHPLTFNSKQNSSSINLHIKTIPKPSRLFNSSTAHKLLLPTLSKSTSPNSTQLNKQTSFSNETPRRSTNYSSLNQKKVMSRPRQIYSRTLAGLDDYNNPKQNQDNSITLKNIFNNNHYDIIGVFDGHGTYGHFVSQFLKNEIERYFTNELLFPSTQSKSILTKLINNNFTLLRSLNSHLQNQLANSSGIDIEFSGSTCILIILIQNSLIISNTGDSRAIMVSRSFNSNTSISQLSTDHKPELPKEKERIIGCQGEVFQEYKSDPYRVWCKGKDYPGIAMSRSLGDTVAKSIGVCYEPEITIRKINRDNMYIIVASDGLWDVLSNKQVEEIVTPFYYRNDIEGASDELLKQTKLQYNNDYNNGRDDITFIIYFLPKKTIKLTIQSSTTLHTIQSNTKLL